MASSLSKVLENAERAFKGEKLSKLMLKGSNAREAEDLVDLFDTENEIINHYDYSEVTKKDGWIDLSGKIPCKAKDYIACNVGSTSNQYPTFVFYKADDTKISDYSPNHNKFIGKKCFITAPVNTAYVRIQSYQNFSEYPQNIMVTINQEMPDFYVPHKNHINEYTEYLNADKFNKIVLSEKNLDGSQKLKFIDKNWFVDDYYVQGKEYLMAWYEKIFNRKNLYISIAGDSLYQEDPSLTYWKNDDGEVGRKANMFFRRLVTQGYDYSKITMQNVALGGKDAQYWLDTSLAMQFEDNGVIKSTVPDLVVVQFGYNDILGSKSYNADITDDKEKVNNYLTYIERCLQRIRGTFNVDGKISYKQTVRAGTSILILTPFFADRRYRLRFQNAMVEGLKRLGRMYGACIVDCGKLYQDLAVTSWSGTQNANNGTDDIHNIAWSNLAMLSEVMEVFMPSTFKQGFSLRGSTYPAAAICGASGNFVKGDFIQNTGASASGDTFGWLCTAGGNPGTWVPVGTVGSNS